MTEQEFYQKLYDDIESKEKKFKELKIRQEETLKLFIESLDREYQKWLKSDEPMDLFNH